MVSINTFENVANVSKKFPKVCGPLGYDVV